MRQLARFLLSQFVKKLRQLRNLQYYLKANVTKIDSDMIYTKFNIHDKGFFMPYSSKYGIHNSDMANLYRGYDKWKLNKYVSGNINIKHTDTVVDCGAYVGGFSIGAAKAGARKIYSIEPSTKSFKSLIRNLEHHDCQDNVTALNIGLDEKVGEMKLNLSKYGANNSFLEPDEGSTSLFEIVKVQTLSNLIEQLNIDPCNLYLKVEAEGFEPEIIRGLENYKPRVITIDVSPERGGVSPREEIRIYLEERGYTHFHNTPSCLFAVI